MSARNVGSGRDEVDASTFPAAAAVVVVVVVVVVADLVSDQGCSCPRSFDPRNWRYLA